MKFIKSTFAVMIFAVLISATITFAQECEQKGTNTASGSDDPVGTKVEGGMLYGKAIDPTVKTISYPELIVGMNESNGNIVTVKGTVSEVCQAMGCWMTMSENGATTRVKTLHEFLLPKDVAGREAIVTGKFNITEISEDDARHFNEESLNPKKSEDIVGPQKAYEIEATGIIILDQAGK
ncbi:MAG: DUF4920 domain-containing protein [Ignavibacteria bacterium]|nr:DUF4920 domain-containing protein [Ignavibacteria bacterium]MBK6876115.1 DUF4920 domain-containing protein [Ignavibacteria bacterium]MBK9226899.1 DUF4920 domain-containing protein [Ignavibacteria bacterium]